MCISSPEPGLDLHIYFKASSGKNAVYLRMLPQMATFVKVAIIKTKIATIVFFPSPPFFLCALSFSPSLFFRLRVFQQFGRKKPVFWPFFTQMTANLVTKFVFTKSARYIYINIYLRLGRDSCQATDRGEGLLGRFSDLRKASGDKLRREKYFREKMEAISIIKLKMRGQKGKTFVLRLTSRTNLLPSAMSVGNAFQFRSAIYPLTLDHLSAICL